MTSKREFHFTYLDDEPPAAVRPYVRAVESKRADLRIEHLSPQAYPKQIEALRERQRAGKLDGLILDLRLDQFVNWQDGSDRADYRAATLAQEIRTRATEGTLPEFPIILFSTDRRLRQSYVSDDTSHDLFDIKAVKEQLESPTGASQVASQLVALVSGYGTIQSAHSNKRGVNRGVTILGFAEAPHYLDSRILNHFLGWDRGLPTHEVARFILRELLDTVGPLVDKETIAARFGIDLRRSPGFDKVLKSFDSARYEGAFATGWPRWWFAQVDEIWRAISGGTLPLRTSSARDRVAFLRSEFGVREISPADPTTEGSSAAFWTVCRASGAPLDPRDGFLLDRQPQYSWQDRVYVSLAALMDGSAKSKRLRIDPLEQDRYKRAGMRVKSREQA